MKREGQEKIIRLTEFFAKTLSKNYNINGKNLD